MKKLLLAFLLTGCMSTVSRPPVLPTFLVGQWVRADFKAAADEDAEPDAGSAVYLLTSGYGMVWCPVAGVPVSVSFDPASRIVSLTELQVDPGPFDPIKVQFICDPRAKTLKMVDFNVADRSKNHLAELYRWRSAKIPEVVRRALTPP